MSIPREKQDLSALKSKILERNAKIKQIQNKSSEEFQKLTQRIDFSIDDNLFLNPKRRKNKQEKIEQEDKLETTSAEITPPNPTLYFSISV